MSAGRRLSVGLGANLRSLVREPFMLGFLFVLPAVLIELYGVSLSSMADFGLFETVASLEATGQVTGAVFATAALSGTLGLFQSLSVQHADRRLRIAGYGMLELFAARVATVVAAGAGVAVIVIGTLDWFLRNGVASPGVALLALLHVGITYGLLGVLVGSILPEELAGSLVLVVLADVDAVFASGLFGITHEAVQFLPLSHPHELVLQAATTGTVASAHVLPAVGHLMALVLLGVMGYSYGLSIGGGSS